MRRREFLSLLSGAVAWPAAVRAQQRLPVIGFIYNGGSQIDAELLAAFRAGLTETGYVEGQNVAFEFRGSVDTRAFPTFAAELVRHEVAVIFSTSLTGAAAARAATASIPVVFLGAGDPVGVDLVASINRPGSNVTGVTTIGVELVPKRLELLRELVPKARLIGFLTNPNRVTGQGGMAEFLAAASKIGQDVLPLNASTPDAIDEAFAIAVSRRVDALLVDIGRVFLTQREQVVALAARHAIPANYPARQFVEAGGLMSYGEDAAIAIRQAANYVGRVLNGEKPAALPVLQPTNFEFAINLKTAKTLGIEFPPSFQLRADVVIE